VQRILDLLGLQHGKAEQIVDRRGGQEGILFARERRKSVAGLRDDDYPGATASDDVTKLLQNQRSSAEINLENRLWRSL